MRPIPLLFALLALPPIGSAQTCHDGRGAGMERGTPGALRMSCDTTWLFHTPQSYPTGLATDGTTYWIGDGSTPRILHVDADGHTLDTLFVPTVHPTSGMYHDGTYLWVVVEGDGTLLKYDPGTGAVVQDLLLPYQATDNNHWGVTGEEGVLWVSVYWTGGQTVLLTLDPVSGTAIDTALIDLPAVLGLVRTEPGLFGIDVQNDLLVRIDPTSGTIVGSVDWCLPQALGIAWSSTTGFVGVSSAILNGGEQAVIRFNGDPLLVPAPTGGNSLEVHPVPATDVVYIDTHAPQPVAITISDAMGRAVLQQRSTPPRTAIAVDALPAGPYLVHATGTTWRSGTRMMVVH